VKNIESYESESKAGRRQGDSPTAARMKSHELGRFPPILICKSRRMNSLPPPLPNSILRTGVWHMTSPSKHWPEYVVDSNHQILYGLPRSAKCKFADGTLQLTEFEHRESPGRWEGKNDS
jgi:hypothetical protein